MCTANLPVYFANQIKCTLLMEKGAYTLFPNLLIVLFITDAIAVRTIVYIARLWGQFA